MRLRYLKNVGATFRSPAVGIGAPPRVKTRGSEIGSRAIYCAGLVSGVTARMALLYLLARGKP